MPVPNVTVGNIIIGPCTSFKVDGTEVGGTDGGVFWEKKTKFADITVDQVPGPLKKAVTEATYTLTTTLAEATLTNLQIAWGLSQAPVTSTNPASTTLNVGIERTAVEHQITFVGPCPAGAGGYTTRTFTVYRAVSMAATKIGVQKDKPQMFQVEFDCLPDLTKPGSEYGTIVDQ